jgi:hypothetical protein
VVCDLMILGGKGKIEFINCMCSWCYKGLFWLGDSSGFVGVVSFDAI